MNFLRSAPLSLFALAWALQVSSAIAAVSPTLAIIKAIARLLMTKSPRWQSEALLEAARHRGEWTQWSH
jgi:hypothetical protein